MVAESDTNPDNVIFTVAVAVAVADDIACSLVDIHGDLLRQPEQEGTLSDVPGARWGRNAERVTQLWQGVQADVEVAQLERFDRQLAERREPCNPKQCSVGRLV